MKRNDTFFKSVCALAVPVALQTMLQSSFSIVDQIMIGQLNSNIIAGVGMAGKFSSIYTVVVSAVGAVAGIMISQYLGQKNKPEVRRSFYLNVLLAGGIGLLFTVLCAFFHRQIMGLYTTDPATRDAAASYLRIISGTFLPLAGATLLSALFRCMEKPKLPLYASIVSAVLNTGLNYVLIFGKFGFREMKAEGAAIATVVSQFANFLIMLLMLVKDPAILKSGRPTAHSRFNWSQYFAMLLPILVCEVLWSLGENVYAAIYGHISTDASAAMTLTNPIQGLLIGALCGLSQAAGVIIGKKLGTGDNAEAYAAAKKLILYGAIGSVILSVLVVLTSGLYVQIYQVEDVVKNLTRQILLAYALVAPFKVLNMILGGGIIRSGGRTKYVLFIDIIGTWGFGVPLGLLTAFTLGWSIPYVYFTLSLEECVRFAISLVVFRRKKWMNQLQASNCE